MRIWISDQEVVARQNGESPTRVGIHAFTSEALVFEIVIYKPDGSGQIADAREWPTVTLGEIRQWLKEKAEVALRAPSRDAVTYLISTEGNIEGFPERAPGVAVLTSVTAPVTPVAEPVHPNSDGDAADVDTMSLHPATPFGGDHVTGVGIQTPPPAFPPRPDDDIPF